MANKMFKEKFTGKYDGVIPAALLENGAIAGGKNMRKVSKGGGWKARRGCILHNTTAAESSSAIKSLHQFKHPRNADYHFITQINNLLLDSAADPPTAGTTLGTTMGVTVGATPGFSCVVGSEFIYTDGTSELLCYGGTAPFPLGFLVYDISNTAYVDYTRNVTDARSDTKAVVLGAATDVFYMISNEPASAVALDLGTAVNAAAETIVVKAWRAGSWTTVTGASDGTASGGATLAKDGTISWTASASDTMTTIANIMGYAYQFSFSGALSGSVDVTSCTVVRAMSSITNKWNGIFEWMAGARYYEVAATEYKEGLGELSNESTSQYLDISAGATGDFLYFKGVEPLTGIGLGIPINYGNTNNAQVDLIEYWDGDEFATVGTLTDTTVDSGATNGFSQTGTIFWNAAALSPQRRTFEGDHTSGYWYRMSWDAALSADTRIYMMVGAIFPENLPKYKGCIEFKDRLVVWGDPEFPNRLRYSATRRYDCFSGSDSGYTDAFGDMSEVNCCVSFYNELLVFKENSIFLLEGFSPATFGVLKVSSTVGLASPKSAYMVEIGYASMHADEPLSIAIWQTFDGVYVLDGRKPRKVSLPVNQFFNPEYSTCLAAASIKDRQAFTDPINNEYHLLLPATELVYNYVLDEFYPPWEREIIIDTGVNLRGTDNRFHTYAASSKGLVMRLENDTSDKSTANADVAIAHSLKTRAFSAEELGVSLLFTLRRVWAVMKARTAGSVTTNLFKNMATTGVTIATPSTISMIATGEGLATEALDLGVQGCSCFQIEFTLEVIDQELEIWSMLYELEARGLLDK